MKKNNISNTKYTPKTKLLAPPVFQKILIRITLPALAAVLIACYIGTGIFASYIHNQEAAGFDSAASLYNFMFNRLNSHYSAAKKEDGSPAMSYANYQKEIQFYLRYSGVASALYSLSETKTELLDSSETKLFVNIERSDGTTASLLSCDAEMDKAYYDFLEEYLNSEGKYFLRVPELYVNWDKWEFIPKEMYLSYSFYEADSQSIFYENSSPMPEGFELLTKENCTVKALLPGTERNRHVTDKKMQNLYDARVAALDHLKNHSPAGTENHTVTYVDKKPWSLSGLWFYMSSLLTDSHLERESSVPLFDENGNLKLYSLCQEHRYSISKDYGTRIILSWFCVILLCLAVCTLFSYLKYTRQKNRWEQESYRRNLTNTMAHDLKSPLMTISGYAENLKEKLHPEKEAYYTEEILKCVNYMNGIVTDLLELERLEQTEITLHKETFSAEDLFRELAAYYQEQMDAKRITFSLTGTCTVNADWKLLKKAFDNLFCNAVIYTPEGNKIIASLNSEQIILTNTGVTLTEEMCRKAFEPFVKEDRSRSGQKGSGLGLSIAKQIFEANGMRCHMESDAGSVSVVVEL